MSCHWISKGLEIEYSNASQDSTEEIEAEINKTAKRKHSWRLEQL
jgi:hypothetical protein